MVKKLWPFALMAILFLLVFVAVRSCRNVVEIIDEELSTEPPTHRWLVWHSDVLTSAGVVQGYMVAGTHIDVSEAGALVVHDKFGVVEMISPYMWSQCWRANPINMRNADRDTTEVFDE